VHIMRPLGLHQSGTNIHDLLLLRQSLDQPLTRCSCPFHALETGEARVGLCARRLHIRRT
jgi:hypothetical protein